MRPQTYNFQADNPLYYWVRQIARLLLKVLGQLESHGNENIPRQGGVLLVSNHVSYLDPVIIASSINRELHFIGADNYFRIPCLGWLFTQLNGFPVKRGTPDRQALQKALSHLQEGKALLIFPEGTRSADGTFGEIKSGVSFIIHRSNVPTIPVFLKGAERLMPHGSKFIRPTKLAVTFGSPLDFAKLRGIHKKQELYRRMSEQIRQAIVALQMKSVR